MVRYAASGAFTPEALNPVLVPLLQDPAPEPAAAAPTWTAAR